MKNIRECFRGRQSLRSHSTSRRNSPKRKRLSAEFTPAAMPSFGLSANLQRLRRITFVTAVCFALLPCSRLPRKCMLMSLRSAVPRRTNISSFKENHSRPQPFYCGTPRRRGIVLTQRQAAPSCTHSSGRPRCAVVRRSHLPCACRLRHKGQPSCSRKIPHFHRDLLLRRTQAADAIRSPRRRQLSCPVRQQPFPLPLFRPCHY